MSKLALKCSDLNLACAKGDFIIVKKISWIALFLVLFLYSISLYTFYSSIHYLWKIAPPGYVLVILSILAFILSIVSFMDTSTLFAKIRSWISTILSFILVSILLFVVTLTSIFSGAKVLLTTTQSPDQHYTINFYKTDAGAMGSFGIVGELQGALWFRKAVYWESKIDQVELQWHNNHTVIVNGHTLDIGSGETWGFQSE
ncbi:DUF5412 domain-containing protein [Paenibacillus sp. ACRSA]|uniref:DUF5412 family protein n=1 Tax=Paenibacillus sp. ACRSA TaxID=2918211 RepID=UPI001EF66771|nr:DUF5412 domain-containing protein [Paenibacillus sp. ACRSA]